jgi:hypothetical protein
MATQWPRKATWPTPIREHATSLSAFLHEVLHLIERSGSQSLPADIVGDIIRGSLTFVLKMQHTPDLTSLNDALQIAQTEAKVNAEHTAAALDHIRNQLLSTTNLVQISATNIQQNGNKVEEAKAAAIEATEIGRANLEMTREIKNKRMQEQVGGPASYAAAAARALPLAGTYNTQSLKTSSVQAQREVVVNIRDPLTIQALRAMNPNNLKAHVERAIEHSSNENRVNAKIVSANQLKSGDLSIKTVTSSEAEALRQSADDWAYRIGTGTAVRIPTYGVLAHGIRTSTMDMEKFEENRNQILQDNRPFIPGAEIKHIGWLTRDASAKTASTITIEFTKPEDANKVIDEGLIWQGEVFQCERYERQCRVKQCFKCQKYGHIGTQCKAPTACGYCAQEHDTRDCPTKSERNGPRKCATCRGEHESWNRQCPTRKDEIAKAKIAYEMRPRYHEVITTENTTVRPATPPAGQRSRPSRDTTYTQTTHTTRSRTQTGRGLKRTNTGITIVPEGQEEQLSQEAINQRPRRSIVRTRRALDTINANTQTAQENNQHRTTNPNTEI